VIYFSDNGPNSFRWNGGMKARKGSTDEGGVRSPAFLRWPAKLPAGHVVKPIAGAIDLLPTLINLTGIRRVGDKPLDGRDLSPLLLKQEIAWTDRMIFSTWSDQVSVRTQRHRLDARGQLYDMVADPGQTTPVNASEPAVAAQLIAAVEAWRRDVLGAGPRLAADAVDPRPLSVGFHEFPVTLLPARDGTPVGGVRRSSSAPNSSYFVNWTSREDQLVWEIEVATTGRYEVSIDYTCPLSDVGSLIELSFNQSRLTGRVAPGWDPPLYTNQDTLPRPPAESKMKEFRSLAFGTIQLSRGQGALTLRALEIPGRSVMDLRRVTLTLLNDP